jgi:hypothetical protein
MYLLTRACLLSAAALVASNAFGAFTGPIVTKVSGGGFTPPEWQNYERCELYQNKVVVTHSYGSGALIKTETRKLSLSGSMTLLAVAERASGETLNSQDNMMCDAPSTSVTAVKVLPTDATEEFTLFTTGGCGSPRLDREGAYSHMLKDLIAQYCTKQLDVID